MQSKKLKRVIAGAFILVAGITAFYQYKYQSLTEDSKEYVVVAKKDIVPNTTITEDYLTLEKRAKSEILNSNIDDPNEIIGFVATETIYKNEDVNLYRLMEKEEFDKKNYRLISIPVKEKDVLVGFTARVNDRVDILFFDKEGTYEGQPYVSDIKIYSMSNENGDEIQFNSSENKASYVQFWIEEKKAEDLNEKLESGGYFKLQIHKDRN